MHPYFTQPAVQAADAAHGIITQAWSPIGGITSYRGTGTSTFDDPAIAAIAAAHGKTPAQIMIRWHLQEGRSAIPKSVRPERIAENFDVFDFELTTDELKVLDTLDTGVRGGPEAGPDHPGELRPPHPRGLTSPHHNRWDWSEACRLSPQAPTWCDRCVLGVGVDAALPDDGYVHALRRWSLHCLLGIV